MASDIDGMTPEQQVGQLFMVGFTGTEPTPAIVELIQQWRVGGVILFSRNCRDARQVSRLTHDLQALARAAGHPAPLLIATDQENGLVRRLGESATSFPGAMALGATGDAQLTQAVAEATGQELSALGINMNLAPDADVNNNAANPVIGVRSFGEDPQLVARLSAATVHGQRAAGIASALKHFPGHGDTATDSHLGLPSVAHSRERLERVEFPPFREGIAAGAEAVMLAHLRLPQIAPDDVAASLSPTVVRLLRDDLSFDGLIATDCLEMDAIAQTVGVEQGALLALHAGVDLVLISHHIEPQRNAIAQVRTAVASGALPAATMRQAVERVLRLKARVASWDALPSPVDADSVSTDAHLRLSALAYARSTTLVRDDERLLPLRLAPDARVVVIAQPPAQVTMAVDTRYRHEDFVAAIRERHPSTSGLLLAANAGVDEVHEAVRAAQAGELVVLVTINAYLDAVQKDLIRRLIATGRPVIGVAVCNPYDVALFSSPQTTLATYDYTRPAMEAASAVLFGASVPQGRLPVTLPDLRSSR